MKSLFYLLCSIVFISCAEKKSEVKIDFTTIFESSGGVQTPTYPEVITYYKNLADAFPSIGIFEMGMTDSGNPLHLVVFEPSGVADDYLENHSDKNILLINNGIHPGESDGIDASMMFLRDLANGTIQVPKNTSIAIIPIYNIGGALNRNSDSRTNQNGPEEYGFRGNARNFDLNRDFIKADTKNAQAFAQIYHQLNPAWFIDNHVSNGADYQYTLTHLFTQHDKLGGALGEYLHTTFMPEFVDSLAAKKWAITPYVNVFNQTPEQGFSQFMDHPRYSTGYTTLFHTLGMMVETHMLKPYKQRVEGTYELMRTFMVLADRDAQKIKALREKSLTDFTAGNTYPISWKIDSAQTSTFNFNGFEGTMELSAITGANRLKYHRDQPFVKPVTYYNYFKPDQYVTIPNKYIIPKGYWNVREQMENNQIIFEEIKQDTVLNVEVYRIENYSTFENPYEGHYPHYNTQVAPTHETWQAHQGDIIIDTQQPGIRYILETLEPSAPDSFFNWNYFDTILQQKEGFSPYVWEDMALAFLTSNPEIKKAFEAKKLSDPDFAGNWYEQLDWIHKQSPYYEKSHLRYPIVRVRD
jgi:hypothetical protein